MIIERIKRKLYTTKTSLLATTNKVNRFTNKFMVEVALSAASKAEDLVAAADARQDAANAARTTEINRRRQKIVDAEAALTSALVNLRAQRGDIANSVPVVDI